MGLDGMHVRALALERNISIVGWDCLHSQIKYRSRAVLGTRIHLCADILFGRHNTETSPMNSCITRSNCPRMVSDVFLTEVHEIPTCVLFLLFLLLGFLPPPSPGKLIDEAFFFLGSVVFQDTGIPVDDMPAGEGRRDKVRPA